MYFRYSAGVVAPMQRISPLESAGFRMFAASSEPSADPAPTSVCSSSMNTMMFGFSVSSFMIALSRSSNWPRYFVPGDNQRDVERQDSLVGQEVRNVAAEDLLREPLDDSRLADARLANQHRVVLRSPAEYLLDALDLVFAADERIEQVLHRRFRQVATELRQQRRFLDALERRLLAEQLSDVVAHALQPHPFLHQDGGGDRTLLAENSEQQMFRADVVVQQPIGFVGRKLQNAFRLGAERNLDRCRDLLPEHRASFDLLADVLEGEMRAREDAARQPLAFANQAKEKMLGLYRDAAELAGLITGEEENPSRPFRIAFEHPACLGLEVGEMRDLCSPL